MTMKKYNINDDIYERVGVVTDSKDQRYSSTHVSGGGSYTSVNNGVAYTTHVPVRSTTSHHHYQTIWIKEKDGTEGSHELYNQDVEFREGHDVALIINENSRQYERFVNLSTGYYWRLRTRAKAKGIIGGIFERIGASFLSLIVVLIPVVNMVIAGAGLYDLLRRKVDYSINNIQRRVLSGVLAFFILAAYYPLIPAVYHLAEKNVPVPVEFSVNVAPEIQRYFMVASAYISGNVSDTSADVASIKKDFDNLSEDNFIKKHRLKKKDIKFNFSSKQSESKYLDSVFMWYSLLLIPACVFMYLVTMLNNKSLRRISELLDERAKQMQQKYNDKPDSKSDETIADDVLEVESS